ncbi:unnamed protein product [Heterobilharzia americana]|nr:unnamed protein product [Heterobilharzia americana]
MRVTGILCFGRRMRRDKLQFLTNRHWRKVGSQLYVDCLRIPEHVVTNPNNPIKKAENMFKSTRYEDNLMKEIEIGVTTEEAYLIEQQNAERLKTFHPLFGDPRCHQDSEPSLIFSKTRRFEKGVDQASLLTNTVVTFDAPPTLDKIFQKISQLNEHVNSDNSVADWRSSLCLAVERSILHAHIWQTDEDLFRILEFQAPYYMKYAELTPIHNQLSNSLPFRWTTRDRLLETYYYWGSKKRRINFSEQHDLAVFGQTPAPLFLSDNDTIHKLSEASVMPTANLGPMSPLIDLTSTLYYREDSTNGWLGNQSRRYSFPHIFTVNFSLPNAWSDYLEPEADPVIPEHRYAIALMNCFASAVAQARTMGITTGVLEVPISVQCVCSDGVYFDFITFQLNNMDVPDYQLDPQSGRTVRKNFAWIDGNYRLFDKVIPKLSMMRNTKYRDMDIAVFDRLTTYYLCGLLDTSFTIPESLLFNCSMNRQVSI